MRCIVVPRPFGTEDVECVKLGSESCEAACTFCEDIILESEEGDYGVIGGVGAVL